LPVVNLVVLEIGLALGLALLAMNPAWWWAAVLGVLIAVPLGLGRWQGLWMVRWIQLWARYRLRSRRRGITTPGPAAGHDDPRLALLQLALPDLAVVPGTDRGREPLGLAWCQGAWTAVLEVDAAPSMITPVDADAAPGLPLSALVPCLADRGVVLDAIQVISHCYPGCAVPPSSSPAARSYLDILGQSPAPARRTTWVAVRLDPRRCPAAVAERGGGVAGCHRALIGALARVRSALESRGVPTRPLDTDQLLRAGTIAAGLALPLPGELHRKTDSRQPVTLAEGWAALAAGGVGHASYAITGWDGAPDLSALAGVRALSTTLVLSLSPGAAGEGVGLRGVLRLSARTPAQLEAAEDQLRAATHRHRLALRPLWGQQLSGLAATLPLGAPG
ncbi:MAG: type VII secretion protein EccE, partial [Pseudonocardiaceae bacterium]